MIPRDVIGQTCESVALCCPSPLGVPGRCEPARVPGPLSNGFNRLPTPAAGRASPVAKDDKSSARVCLQHAGNTAATRASSADRVPPVFLPHLLAPVCRRPGLLASPLMPGSDGTPPMRSPQATGSFSRRLAVVVAYLDIVSTGYPNIASPLGPGRNRVLRPHFPPTLGQPWPSAASVRNSRSSRRRSSSGRLSKASARRCRSGCAETVPLFVPPGLHVST